MVWFVLGDSNISISNRGQVLFILFYFLFSWPKCLTGFSLSLSLQFIFCAVSILWLFLCCFILCYFSSVTFLVIFGAKWHKQEVPQCMIMQKILWNQVYEIQTKTNRQLGTRAGTLDRSGGDFFQTDFSQNPAFDRSLISPLPFGHWATENLYF